MQRQHASEWQLAGMPQLSFDLVHRPSTVCLLLPQLSSTVWARVLGQSGQKTTEQVAAGETNIYARGHCPGSLFGQLPALRGHH